MILREILGLHPFEFKWVENGIRAVFNDGIQNLGVLIDDLSLDLESRSLSVVNVSFGVIKGETFQDEDDLNTTLTASHSARKVFSTVAAICKESSILQNANIICLGGGDEHKDRRSVLYSIAWNEINHSIPKFKGIKPVKLKTDSDSILLIMSSVELSKDETEKVLSALNFVKA